MQINGVTVDEGKFIGRIKVDEAGKVQVVTETTDGNETTWWFAWEEIKTAVDEVLRERERDEKEIER